MRNAPLGLAAVHTVLPGLQACACAIGNASVDVVLSPWLLGLIEEACHRVVRDLFEPGEGTVGVLLELRHHAAALPGREVTAHVQLAALEGRKLRFTVQAFQGAVSLMSGAYERVLVDLDGFMATAGSAAEAAAQVSKQGNKRRCKLVSKRHRKRHAEQDTAQQLGLALRCHPRFPLCPARALRALAYAAQKGLAAPFFSTRRLRLGIACSSKPHRAQPAQFLNVWLDTDTRQVPQLHRTITHPANGRAQRGAQGLSLASTSSMPQGRPRAASTGAVDRDAKMRERAWWLRVVNASSVEPGHETLPSCCR